MVDRDFRVSEESRPVLDRYAALPLSDPRRVELFAFLAEAVSEPHRVAFEQDDAGLRWTWLEHVALVWKLDISNNELDVIDAWDEDDESSQPW